MKLLRDQSIEKCNPGFRLSALATLLFASLLAGSGMANAAEREMKLGKPLRASNKAAAKLANGALNKVKRSGHWFENSTEVKAEAGGGNPQIRVPDIRIFCGNSYLGVFDLVNARAVTAELFAAYGVNLKAGYRIKRNGIEFEADGYDPQTGIGYEIVGAENPPQRYIISQVKVKIDRTKVLDEKEVEKLKKLIGEGKVTMFFVPAKDYPNMDGDQYTGAIRSGA